MGNPSPRRAIAIGAVLTVLALIGGLLAPDREEPREPPPSGQTQPDRPRP